MNSEILKSKLFEKNKDDNGLLFSLKGLSNIDYYNTSVMEYEGSVFFIGRESGGKFLYLASSADTTELLEKFEGENQILKCKLIQ